MRRDAEAAGLTRLRAPGELGRSREEILREFFRKRLPARFGVATGIVLASAAEFTSQQDIVIFDRLNHAPLDENEASALLTADAVSATFEVKTNLSRSELKAVVEKVRKLKTQLRAAPHEFVGKPALTESICGLFAFSGPDAPQLHAWLADLQQGIPIPDRLDFVCVLGKALARGGTYFEVSNFGEIGSEYRTKLGAREADQRAQYPDHLSTWEVGEHSLFVLMHQLMSYITRRPDTIPNWSNYVPPAFEFGAEVPTARRVAG